MAAKEHTPNRARFRKRQTLQKRHHPRRRQGLSRPRPVVRAKRARRRPPHELNRLHEALTSHIRGLEVAMSAVIVSVSALRRQNCDIDEDIARVLERSAADRLDIEIEKLQSLVNQEKPP